MPHHKGRNEGFHLKLLLEKNAFPTCLIIESGTRDFNSNFSHEKNSLTRDFTSNFSCRELINKGFHLKLLYHGEELINMYKNG